MHDRMNFWYWFGRMFSRTLMRTFGHIEVVGKENIPPFGPLIVAPNHQSNADPPLVAGVFDRPLYFMGKRGLFANAFVSYFMRGFHVYPVDRNGRDVGALTWAIRLLEQDRAVVVFPEGVRSPKALKPAEGGVTYLALRSRAPIVPVAITGTERIPSYIRTGFHFQRLKVVIGQPFTLPEIEGPITRPLPRHVLESMSNMIMERIAQLLPPDYRGDYYRGLTRGSKANGGGEAVL